MDICEGLWPLPALPERNACNELVSDKMLSTVGGLETVEIPCCKHRFGSWRGQMMECKCWGCFWGGSMGKEGKGGHLKVVWSQFLGQQWWRQWSAASAANGDVLVKRRKTKPKSIQWHRGGTKTQRGREAEQEKGDLISDQHPPGAQCSH